ncbi:Pimeloyl-ACP methyl ester carboxylesterase [Asanoa hainanensis]|uniref:Pimeloyl-ACP methyl ester carboxylesterase n=1 Tax=Asanoa hainanensis TaxID=560556 RepID=A0A239J0M8_9ACTN|nr:alpha/beta hydrolase [Asanoa hainanensis]SNS99461.1 Pimeloyl-ACP methyl ester carboxylesterase [Asanoa hainanensis]
MTEYVDTGRVKLACRTVAGPPGAVPMVLLHGGGGDGTSWDQLAPRFAQDRPVYVPDLRGMGASERSGPYGPTVFRDDLLALLDKLSLDRVVLVGHSLGGLVALLTTLAAPDRVAALVLEECPPPTPLGIPVPTDLPESAPFYDREIRPSVLAALNAPDPAWWDGLAGINVPVLVVAGGPDSFLPQDRMAEMAEQIPAGEFTTIPVGHVVHPNAPNSFADAVETFLAGR